MKILIIVNESPWSTSLGVTSLRLVRAMLNDKVQIPAVFFREDGVYHAEPGRALDNGTPCLADAWRALSEQSGVPMLLCSAAAQRRLGEASRPGFREAGLAEVMELMVSCDRVVTF